MSLPRPRTRAALAATVPFLLLVTGCGSPDAPSAAPATSTSAATSAAETGSTDAAAEAALAALETEFGVRLGVFAVDTGSEEVVEHRADELFPYASTYKALAAAAVLDRTTPAQLDEVVTYTTEDLVTYSPVTELHVDTGMTLHDVAAAAVQVSDNTAGNLLVDQLGGTAAFEQELRELGDETTSADRYEPELNTAVPGDERDTSTPRALATDLRAVAVDDALEPDDRALLLEWMRTATTGAALVRAGVPAGWEVADKSGSAEHGTRNDIAVVQPPGRAPIVLAVLSTHPGADAEPSDAVVARAAEVVATALR
ncbi:class A beta-lactamase [Modestobacter sp. VKM Ac-2979]|uniref:class A beta-lactamase n=1 Tax=unclassified Modestobacter TaxID=2643866 RepID=UPI0022AB8D4A|nr:MULTISPECIES: class A beta-lactamase [unclassified Modestobacter]MCZ2809929.1 class A beta-lactamase [Modestobacter sp. VKM Ac-2979]MCZ2842656.1 class A beta-lactamase [Modestobacter sp. VKM Ac-2980]